MKKWLWIALVSSALSGCAGWAPDKFWSEAFPPEQRVDNEQDCLALSLTSAECQAALYRQVMRDELQRDRRKRAVRGLWPQHATCIGGNGVYNCNTW